MSENNDAKKRRKAIEKKIVKLGHKPENKSCDHHHYKFVKHGCYCTCGTIMVDFGD